MLWRRYFVPNPSFQSKSKTPDVPDKLELLKGISGYAEPGQLTALMVGAPAASPVAVLRLRLLLSPLLHAALACCRAAAGQARPRSWTA